LKKGKRKNEERGEESKEASCAIGADKTTTTGKKAALKRRARTRKNKGNKKGEPESATKK